MTDPDAYAEWLHQMSYLSLEETLALPSWQQPVALIQQLAVSHLNNGAAALFYNDADKIQPTAASLNTIGEANLSELILQIFHALSPIFDENPSDLQNVLADHLIGGPTAGLAQKLDALIEERWDELHAKLRKLAETNGWSP